jgi:Double zinc ribbon
MSFDMVKKCEQCGAPAVDSQSLFCNLCGGYIRDEPEAALPVCRICGIPAPDEQSAFCTRCGQKYPQEPEDIYPVCTSCGSIVPDELATFCNRCGEKISSTTESSSQPLCPTCGAPAVDEQTLFCNRCGTPFSRPGAAGTGKKKAESVIITKKRRSPVPPAHRGGEVSETPFPNPPPSSLPVQPDTQAKKKFAHLPLQADENVPDIPRSKKYTHLPMVADELMIKDSSNHGHHSTDVHELPAGRPKKHYPNKGLLDMFKH